MQLTIGYTGLLIFPRFTGHLFNYEKVLYASLQEPEKDKTILT